MAGLSKNGMSLIAHGSPPTLAHIYIRIFEQILRTFFPLEIVLAKTTCEGTGRSFSKSLLRSSYSGAFPFPPGRIRTTACTDGFKFPLSAYSQSLNRFDRTGNSLGRPTL